MSRASVHNISIMEAMELGVGDTITVYKANMIIPQIAENLTRSGNIVIPKICPVCGGETTDSPDERCQILILHESGLPGEEDKSLPPCWSAGMR